MIGIFGAGSIGCFVGGMLAAAGERITLVGRRAMADRLAGGIALSGLEGPQIELPASRFAFSTDATALADCETVLICVKSGDTREAGRSLAGVLAPAATVVSMQNGIGNASALREALPGRIVLGAMVPFNVAQIGRGRFHRGTEGIIVVESGGEAIAAMLTRAGMPAAATPDIEGVMWGKLLMNLNNAVNALSGLPLKAQLSDRDYRRALALSVAEGLRVLRAAGISPARIGRVRPQIVPFVLRLPDPLFRIVAAGMLKVDEAARSSMADDLAAGRKSEIDHLNGEIVRLGKATGTPTPVNARLVELVKDAFEAGASPKMSGRALLDALRV